MSGCGVGTLAVALGFASSIFTTRTPDSPNSANPQSPVASPHLHLYPPIASGERQAHVISSGSSPACHVHIPLPKAFLILNDAQPDPYRVRAGLVQLARALVPLSLDSYCSGEGWQTPKPFSSPMYSPKDTPVGRGCSHPEATSCKPTHDVTCFRHTVLTSRAYLPDLAVALAIIHRLCRPMRLETQRL